MPTYLLIMIRYELWVFVGGLAVIITYRFLTGAINLDCLLNSKGSGGAYSPARLQLLLITIGGGIYYATLCFQAKNFAPVPTALTTALGGSNAIYLLRKAVDTFAR